MPRQPETRGAIGIVGGSRVVGEALEVLLQGQGYRPRFVVSPGDVGGQVLTDCQLIVLAPGVSAAERDAILAALDEAGGSSLMVLELTRGRVPDGDRRYVHWPCRAVELARIIDAALQPPAVRAHA